MDKFSFRRGYVRMCTAVVPAMWYIGGWFVRRSLGEGGCRPLASTADRIRIAQAFVRIRPLLYVRQTGVLQEAD